MYVINLAKRENYLLVLDSFLKDFDLKITLA